MTAIADPDEDAPKKKSKKPLILGLVLALLGGGGGFAAVSMGLIGGSDGHAEDEAAAIDIPLADLPPMAFVPLDPLIVSLPESGGTTHLRFSAQLEVVPDYAADVEQIKPRIVDVLNGYLRAVELEELADPQVLSKLRGQMLRRVQVVAGEGRVRDLLIMEFVLN